MTKPPALDFRKTLPDKIYFLNACPATDQKLIRSSKIVQRDLRRYWQLHQRGSSARDQKYDQRIGRTGLHKRGYPLPGSQAFGVRQRMPGYHHFRRHVDLESLIRDQDSSFYPIAEQCFNSGPHLHASLAHSNQHYFAISIQSYVVAAQLEDSIVDSHLLFDPRAGFDCS